MKRQLRVIDDPRLDRIFSDAYFATLPAIEKAEREKQVKDRIEALSDLFEMDLRTKDLTEAERTSIVGAFKSYVVEMEQREEQRSRGRKTSLIFATGGFAFIVVLTLILYIGIRRPFASLTKVEQDLSYYLEQVDGGYGEYSEKYYKTLKIFNNRLGPAKTANYRRQMNGELEEQFDVLIVALEAGEVTRYDDARKWAGYFPEREMRRAKKEEAQNALVQGAGGAIGDSVRSLLKSVGETLKNTADYIKAKVDEK